jgi:uncharacterized protein (DUF1810 family)
VSTDFDLQRFVDAQAPVYAQVVKELRAGHKTSHWMWFVFPQLRGLGRSDTAYHYGLTGVAEALAYLQHPSLGPRLRECCELLDNQEKRSAEGIFGGIDAMKFHSCLTLFTRASSGEVLFERLLARYFNGEQDAKTLELLSA